MAIFDKEKKDMRSVNCYQELMKTKVKQRKTLLKYCLLSKYVDKVTKGSFFLFEQN